MGDPGLNAGGLSHRPSAGLGPCAAALRGEGQADDRHDQREGPAPRWGVWFRPKASSSPVTGLQGAERSVGGNLDRGSSQGNEREFTTAPAARRSRLTLNSVAETAAVAYSPESVGWRGSAGWFCCCLSVICQESYVGICWIDMCGQLGHQW